MWQAIAAAAAQAAMKRIQKKRSGAFLQDDIAEAQQAFADMESGEMSLRPAKAEPGLLGDFAKAYLGGQITGMVTGTPSSTEQFGAAPGSTLGTPQMYGAPPDRTAFLQQTGFDTAKLQQLFSQIEPKFAFAFNALIDAILNKQKGGMK